MVAAVVAKFHLHRFRAARQRQQLMAEADAKHRNFRLEESFDRADSVIARLRVAWSVREENPVWVKLQHLFGRRLRRHHRQATAAIHQHAENIEFHAVIVGHDVIRQRFRALRLRQALVQRPGALLPAIGLRRCDFFRQIHPFQSRERLRFLQRQRRIRVVARDDAAVLRPFFTQQARQLAGVDIGDAHHVIALQVS